MNALYGVKSYKLESWDQDFEGNIPQAKEILKSSAGLALGSRVMLVNDLRHDDKETPIVELVEIV